LCLPPHARRWRSRPSARTARTVHGGTPCRPASRAIGDGHGQMGEDDPGIAGMPDDPTPAMASDIASVRPLRSASSDSSAVPACDTRFFPSVEPSSTGWREYRASSRSSPEPG
jgi:hypothetical protein